MSTVTIRKTFSNSNTLFEADLNTIITSLNSYLTNTRLDTENIADAGVKAINIAEGVLDTDIFELNGSSKFTIKDESIPADAFDLPERQAAIGTTCMFYDFNGTLSVPRGWMSCNGQVINETNYDAIHGAGAYAADGIASSAILGKYLRGINSSNTFIQIAASTTQSGSTAQTTTGSNTLDLSHEHSWYKHFDAANRQIQYTSGTWVDISGSNMATSDTSKNLSTAQSSAIADVADGLSGDHTWDSQINTDVTAVSFEPTNNAVIYIMKVI